MTADLGPAATPRPIPTPEDRMTAARQPGPTFATYLDRHDRDQLDARAATAEQERDDALDDLQTARADLQQLRTKLDLARGQRDEALEARDVLRHQLDQQSAILASKRNTITALAAELGAAQELIADCRAFIDRPWVSENALRDAQSLVQRIDAPGLGSPADRAQDEPESSVRRLLDQAIESALPHAGGNVRPLLKALRRELKRVDAKRAEKAEG